MIPISLLKIFLFTRNNPKIPKKYIQFIERTLNTQKNTKDGSSRHKSATKKCTLFNINNLGVVLKIIFFW